jgi:hypothetical protein
MTELSIPTLLTPLMQGTHFLNLLDVSSDMAFPPGPSSSIYLLLLIDAIFARSTIDQQKESTNNRENLEEVVLGKVFVGVVLMKLDKN